MTSLFKILFPNFNPPPTSENAGVKPVQTSKNLNLEKADEELRSLFEARRPS